jgi:cobalamin biosynthesis protein CobT
MLMTGLIFHEIGHKNHTTGGKPDGFLGDMMNVIEDVRVEMETIKKRPGTCYNLDAITTYYAKQGSFEPNELNHALLGKVMAHGRGNVLNQKALAPLEAACNEMMDDAFGQDFIGDVEVIIKDIPNLKNTSETEAMAQKLINLLLQQKNPPPPPQQPQPKPQKQEEQPSGGSESGGQGRGEEDNSKEDKSDQNGQSGGSGDQEDGNEEQNQSTSSKSDSQQQDDQGNQDDSKEESSGSGGNGAGSGGGKRPTPEEIDEMLKQQTGYGDLSRMIQDELNNLADQIPDSLKASIPCLPRVGRLPARNGKLDEVEAISASSRMRAKVMGMLQSIKRQPKSFGSSGRKLATGKLVKMATGDPKIFKKKIETIDTNTAVTVFLDLSGSMDDKYQIANAAAFALHNTLFGLKGVSVCSCEFSGKEDDDDCRPEVNVLADFGRKPLSENFNHYPFDGTPTDEAIWAGRAMLLQRPEPRKIMLILTDGCPNKQDLTAAATTRAMKDGIEIAAIGIMSNAVRNYWKNNRVIYNLQELPTAMFGVMEDLLTRQP